MDVDAIEGCVGVTQCLLVSTLHVQEDDVHSVGFGNGAISIQESFVFVVRVSVKELVRADASVLSDTMLRLVTFLMCEFSGYGNNCGRFDTDVGKTRADKGMWQSHSQQPKPRNGERPTSNKTDLDS